MALASCVLGFQVNYDDCRQDLGKAPLTYHVFAIGCLLRTMSVSTDVLLSFCCAVVDPYVVLASMSNCTLVNPTVLSLFDPSRLYDPSFTYRPDSAEQSTDSANGLLFLTKEV